MDNEIDIKLSLSTNLLKNEVHRSSQWCQVIFRSSDPLSLHWQSPTLTSYTYYLQRTVVALPPFGCALIDHQPSQPRVTIFNSFNASRCIWLSHASRIQNLFDHLKASSQWPYFSKSGLVSIGLAAWGSILVTGKMITAWYLQSIHVHLCPWGLLWAQSVLYMNYA